MTNPFIDIRDEVRAALQWQQGFFDALDDRPQGMFAKEFYEWFVAHGHELGDHVPDLDNRDDVRALRKCFLHHRQNGVSWKLLESTVEYPARVYGGDGYLDEKCIRLTQKGRWLASKGRARRTLFFVPRVLLLAVRFYRQKWSGPIAVAVGAAGFLRVALAWEPARSALSGLALGVLAFGLQVIFAARVAAPDRISE